MAALHLFRSDLERAAERRDDSDWQTRATASGASLVPLWRGRNLVSTGAPQSAVYPPASILAECDPTAEPIFLGVLPQGAACIAIALPEDDDEPHALARLRLTDDSARFADLRSLRAHLPASDAAILGYASALVHWNAVTRFCSACGAPTRSTSAGHVRRCTNPSDGRQHFPRTDPAVIMLVHDGDRALLGRQKEWPVGMYSALAGFVEPGESLEDTVEREVLEESGVRIDDIRYYASQPWPYPQSLMLGFFARATSHRVTRGDELEDVRWFSREEVAALGAERALSLPGVDTIARRLIGAWQRGDHAL